MDQCGGRLRLLSSAPLRFFSSQRRQERDGDATFNAVADRTKAVGADNPRPPTHLALRPFRMPRFLRLLFVVPLLVVELLLAVAVTGGCALLFDMRLNVPLEKGETFTLPERRPFGDRG